MRLRAPHGDTVSGNETGKALKNVLLLVLLCGVAYVSSLGKSAPSLSSFVPQFELVTDTATKESTAKDTNVEGETKTERKLDSKTKNATKEAEQRGSSKDSKESKIDSLNMEPDTTTDADKQEEASTGESENTPAVDNHLGEKEIKKETESPPGEDNGLSTEKPLNIIIFYPDDWGGRDLQDCNPLLKTPNFSEIAREGIRFTHNAVTTSICWISRATLFTGQYVSSHRSTYLFRPTFSNPDKWAKTWPYLLRQAGYWVGHVGKWQYRAGKDRGSLFDFGKFFEGWTMIEDKFGKRTYNAELARDTTLQFLQERPKDKPFAATVAFYPPKGISHIEEVKPEFAAMYKNMTHPEAYDRAMAYNRLPSFLQDNGTEARSRYLYRFETNGDFQESMSAQYATLTHIDAMVGEIIDELKSQGVYDNTMVIVTADNGEFHGAHALADKWYPYSESIHVPLIIRDPRMPKKKQGTLDDSFTLNIDLAETILGAAGLQPPKEMDGRDIGDLYLDNPQSTEPWRDHFFYEFPLINGKIPPSRALVRKDWKYIDWYMNDHEELFDMKQDPFELHNVANHSEWASLKADLKHQLEILKHEVYSPLVPDTRCDGIQPAGSDLSLLPNCSQTLPEICCPLEVI